MYKFFVENKQIEGDQITISGEDVNHIKNVLRLNVGEDILVCNRETEITYVCCIQNFHAFEVNCVILKENKETV